MKSYEQNFCKNVELTDGCEICINTDIFDIIIKPSENNELIISGSFSGKAEDMVIPFEGKLEHDKEKRYLSFNAYESDIREKFNFESIAKAKLLIEVPEIAFSQGDTLYIENIHSNISIENLKGKINTKSTNGSVKIDNAGEVVIFTNNGDIKLINPLNLIKASSVNGDIKVKQGVGIELDLSSDNGDVKVLDCDFKKIYCKSNNGDIYSEVIYDDHEQFILSSVNGDIVFKIDNDACKDIKLKSSNGDIKIVLPDEVHINLDLKTLYGDIVNHLEVDEAVETIIDENHFFVNYGDDLSTVNAETTHGDIKLNCDENIFYKILEREIKKAEELLKELSKSKTAESAKEVIDNVLQSLNSTLSKLKEKVSGEEAQKYQDRITKLVDQIKNQVTKDNIEDIFEKAKNIINDVAEKISPLSKHFKDKNFNVYSHSEEKPSKWNKYFDKNENIAILKILDMVEKNTITAEEAEKLIKALKK